MQLVLLLLFGSILFGLGFEKLNRRALIAISALILVAVVGFLYFKRFL